MGEPTSVELGEVTRDLREKSFDARCLLVRGASSDIERYAETASSLGEDVDTRVAVEGVELSDVDDEDQLERAPRQLRCWERRCSFSGDGKTSLERSKEEKRRLQWVGVVRSCRSRGRVPQVARLSRLRAAALTKLRGSSYSA